MPKKADHIFYVYFTTNADGRKIAAGPTSATSAAALVFTLNQCIDISRRGIATSFPESLCPDDFISVLDLVAWIHKARAAA